ncbi:3-hydroxyacyl-[acyl-carrier-protein] dehydratase [Maribacter sedimenticola]|uniref:3-hydroxyacyl-[acyl-carrier-protein] dehydratase n=2 Tax=Maribacter sedimenticola TaxID=228956 RepID=A0ABY1SGE1_9FLAO|nr:3-hydroxyacyl-[acyl-carrier-protein] dehydratase [Maribacter sedimenticola]
MEGKVYSNEYSKKMSERSWQWVLEALPYTEPFLFVDELTNIHATGAEGRYRFPPDAYFYKGHFKDRPVTPGVLLTECCAQIGLVSLGIFLLKNEKNLQHLTIGMSSTAMEFLKPVFPGEIVRVVSVLEYFRFQKLKCSVKMFNEENNLVCKGTIAGMIGFNNG